MSSALTEEYLNLNETGFSIRVSTDMRVNLHMTFFRQFSQGPTNRNGSH